MFSSNSSTVSGDANYIEDVFSTYLYTGNGSTQTITNGIDLAGKGGLTWLKVRNTTSSHFLFDTSRGTNALFSNLTNAQQSEPQGITSFNANGFTLGTNGGTNGADNTFVSWTFRKQPKFFDVVTYTGNDVANRQIAHSLGVAPGMIIIKCTSNDYSWYVYHRSLGANQELRLNTTGAATTGAFFPTTPTSSDFYVKADGGVNGSGETYVAYLFAHNAGGFGGTGTDNVITCGNYTGVAYPDSQEVNVGFEPQWVMIKNTTTASGWSMWDSMRGMAVVPAANVAQAQLLEPNTSAAEGIQPGIYPTATGFVVKNGLTAISGLGDNFIYIAIRRGPMKVPTDGTKVFQPNTNTANPATYEYTPGFATDWAIFSYRGSSAYWYTGSRLQGAPRLLFFNDTAVEEGTVKSWYFDNPTGTFKQTVGGDGVNSIITYMFGRAPSFMDVVCDTGTGVARTVAHNLAAAPELIIRKNRDGTPRNWTIACTYLPNGFSDYLLLNSDTNVGTNSTYWNATAPTTSVFSVGTNITNTASVKYVSYLFATCAGVSKVGNYTGTGTTQAINCGFTAGARFVLIKRTDSTGDWYVWDSARGIVSGNDPYLLMNTAAAEVTSTDYIDPSSAGFEISSTAPAAINASGGSFIFLAVA